MTPIIQFAFQRTLSESDNDIVVINREYVASEKAPPRGQRHSESAKKEGKGEEIERHRDSKRRSVAQLARDHNIFRVPGNRT